LRAVRAPGEAKREVAVRRVAAAATLGLAAAAVTLVASAAGRLAARPPASATVTSSADLRIPLGLPSDGRPRVILVLDPGCGACREAEADLPELRRLEAAGIAVTARDRADARPLGLEPGPWPAYVLLGPEGRRLAVRRGRMPPGAVLLWVRGRLLATP